MDTHAQQTKHWKFSKPSVSSVSQNALLVMLGRVLSSVWSMHRSLMLNVFLRLTCSLQPADRDVQN